MKTFHWVKVLLVAFVVVFISSCDSKSKLEKTIGSIPVDLNIVRFDTIFAHAEISGLPQLKKEFPFFFPDRVSI